MAKRKQRARRAEVKAHKRAGKPEGQLPALSSLTELPRFDELQPSERQRAAFEQYLQGVGDQGQLERRCELGCVVRLDRGFPAVLTASETFRAEFAASLTKSDFSRVAVGDWVCVRTPGGHDMGVIEQILPRESDIARWRGGARGEKQTLAANVDVVLVVQALEEWRLSANRVARSAVVATDCGAEVAVVLTKADKVGAEVVQSACDLVHEVLGDACPVVAVSSMGSAASQEGVEQVRALIPAGKVGIMLGPSGVGKSTLLNALLGRDALETGAVRESDGAGRHTTVARRMVAVPGGGVLVDEPGLRTLQMVGHERGLQLVFPDIADAAAHCRFRDCTHTHEPGCEVLARFGDSGARLDTYLALAAEMRASAQTLDPDVVL